MNEEKKEEVQLEIHVSVHPVVIEIIEDLMKVKVGDADVLLYRKYEVVREALVKGLVLMAQEKALFTKIITVEAKRCIVEKLKIVGGGGDAGK